MSVLSLVCLCFVKNRQIQPPVFFQLEKYEAFIYKSSENNQSFILHIFLFSNMNHLQDLYDVMGWEVRVSDDQRQYLLFKDPDTQRLISCVHTLKHTFLQKIKMLVYNTAFIQTYFVHAAVLGSMNEL